MNDQGGIYWRSAPNWATREAQSGNGFYLAGVLVFWDSRSGAVDSHVAISVGGGKLVSTNVDQPGATGYNGFTTETMSQFGQNSWNIYKGWRLPDR